MEQLGEIISSPQAVLVPIAERHQELQQMSLGYPDREVVLSVDGLTPLDDIIRRLPVTQLDVECIVAEFIEDGFFRELTPDEIIERAQYLEGQADITRASQLYRAVLSIDPTRSDAVERLGALLAHLGAGPEAAQCYTELATVFLKADRQAEALEAARSANDFYYTPHTALLLVRCLIAGGDDNQAVLVAA